MSAARRSVTRSNELRRCVLSVTRQSRMRRRASGKCGATSSMLFGCFVAMATMSALKFGASNARLPLSASKSIEPNANTSVRPSMPAAPIACSGLM